MKRYIWIGACMAIVILSGCGLFSQSSGSPIGGMMKSEDGGANFASRAYIDEKTSLGKSNVLSAVVDPSNNNTVYIGTANNDVFKTVDGADSWVPLVTGLQNIASIAINPFQTQTLYVSGMYNGRGSVVKSTDGGETWERVYLEPSDQTNVSAMVVSPSQGDTVYIGTTGGTIACTYDGGKTWVNLHDVERAVRSIVIDHIDTQTIYALIETSEILKSRDGGAVFEDIADIERTEEEPMYQGNLYSLAVSPTTAGVVVVGTDAGVFRSYDYGRTWEDIDVIASTRGIPVHAVAVNPHDASKLMYAAAKAVYSSLDGGWAITDTTSNRTVSVVLYDPINPQIVYIGLQKSE